jgi:hypothetical protein
MLLENRYMFYKSTDEQLKARLFAKLIFDIMQTIERKELYMDFVVA